MRTTLATFLSLFISCFILFLGNGLINVLLPVRMGVDGISTDAIGMVLSLYFVGMLIGAVYSKHLIKRSGHIRMFAGCVALSAISILICSLYSDPILWGAMRILIGFCNACALTAMESWLSDSSSKEVRGKVLAVYQAVVLSGLFGGQFLMNLANPGETLLFVLAGILLCAAVIPLSLSRNAGPVVEEVSSMSLLALYKISPLGVVSCLISGMIYSAVFNMLPVFASDYGIVEFQLSLYMGAAIAGAFLLQFPVGYLADRFDRRTVLMLLLVISAVFGVLVNMFVALGMMGAMFVATGITSGIIACTYPISIAEAFDKLRQSEMVAAMGSLILAFSIGGVLGPYTSSLVMKVFGNTALFYFLGLVQLSLALFVAYRMTVRQALPVEDQESFVMQGAATLAFVDLDPRTEYSESVQPLSSEAETAVSIAETDPAAAVKMARAIAMSDPTRGVEVAAAVATVSGIDVLRLYEVMNEAVPYQILNVTRAIVTAKPELAGELVSKLAESHSSQVISVAAEIGLAFPELRVEMARVAVANAPESATEVAAYYARVLAEEREDVRPADRDDDTSEADMVNIASELWEASPDQALDVAAAMVDAVPETAVSVAEEYIASAMHEQQDQPQGTEILSEDEGYQGTVDLVARISEIAPEQALDVAVAVVEAVPDSAAEVAAEVAGNISDSDDGSESSVWAGDSSDNEAAVELTQRLSDAAPDSVLDVAVAVVEALPGSAADVASEVAGNISDSDDGSESSVWAGDSSDNEAAVELTQRLSDAAPDNVLDVAVAVVEALPDSAADVASEVAGNISDNDDGSESSVWAGDSSDNEAAVELTQRLSDAAPDNVLDVAVAVVEALPDSAADVASEVAGNISDTDDGSESCVWTGDSSDNEAAVELTQRLSDAAPDNALDVAVAVVEAVPESAADVASEVAGNISDDADGSENSSWAGDSSDNEAAVELTQRLSDAAPDNALDVAVAVVEAVPESAAEVASEVAGNISDNEDGSESSSWTGDSSDNEAAVELTQRLSEAAPGNALDVAVAVVEALPESASDVLDEISSGAEARNGEWMESVDDKPKQ
ncbi:MFS transporter [Amphritea sp. HPY]|uniref:MFS transporter n=1 Tax=Amphritea sp. HPY TaxID=3421652 RepID=UPI003D7EDD1E